MDTALRAGPFAYGQRKLRQFEAAARAAFRGREESVDSDEKLSGSFGLVLAHTHELAPAGIGNRLCQMVCISRLAAERLSISAERLHRISGAGLTSYQNWLVRLRRHVREGA